MKFNLVNKNNMNNRPRNKIVIKYFFDSSVSVTKQYIQVSLLLIVL